MKSWNDLFFFEFGFNNQKDFWVIIEIKFIGTLHMQVYDFWNSKRFK